MRTDRDEARLRDIRTRFALGSTLYREDARDLLRFLDERISPIREAVESGDEDRNYQFDAKVLLSLLGPPKPKPESKSGKRSSQPRDRCVECDYEGELSPFLGHQKRTGHHGYVRITS